MKNEGGVAGTNFCDGRRTPDSTKTIYLPLKGGGDIMIMIDIKSPNKEGQVFYSVKNMVNY